jgi:hypothetical protein
MFNLFGNERKVKRLKKDALTIIRSDEVAYSPAHLKACASMVAEYQAATVLATPKTKTGHGSAIWLKEQHRDARRRRDQIQLTAVTLSIIYLRARKLGQAGTAICQSIDNAMEQWAGGSDASAQAEANPTQDSSPPAPE